MQSKGKSKTFPLILLGQYYPATVVVKSDKMAERIFCFFCVHAWFRKAGNGPSYPLSSPICKRYGVALHSRYFAIKLGAATAIYLESGQNLVYFGKVVKIPGPQLETKSHSRVRWQPMPPLAATWSTKRQLWQKRGRGRHRHHHAVRISRNHGGRCFGHPLVTRMRSAIRPPLGIRIMLDLSA